MDDTFIKQAINKTFFALHPIFMKLGAATLPRFIKILEDKQKSLIAHLKDVSSVKVPLRSC